MNILVVDDEPSLREVLELLLSRLGHSVSLAAHATDAIAKLHAQPFDLVVSDMNLWDGTGMDVLRSARGRKDPPEVILITAFGTPASAVQAMREGAYDYICKPFDNEELKLLAEKALEKRRLRLENDALRERLVQAGGAVTGRSEAMHGVWQLVEKVAASRTTVLISGESGTGKEMIARAIHLKSDRASRPFVPVNCAALNEGVLESELFGHVRGAFTGATTDRPGILVSAEDGTVLLDEVGEISQSIQVKLLRVLQERKVKPVGGSREVPFAARIVAATNKDLEAEVKAGRFREDLFYRLNVISIELPPLRERKEDIAALAEHFLTRMRKELGRSSLTFAPETIELLKAFPFPGNVRQLENIVERAATLADHDLLGPSVLPATLTGAREEALPGTAAALEPGFSLEKHLDSLERALLLDALGRAGGVKTRAAQLLGLTFRSFRYRLSKHGLDDRDEAGS